MTVTVQGVNKAYVQSLISSSPQVTMSEAERFEFFRALQATTELYVGFEDDQLVCVWGLCPPTLLSDTAYLWLHTTPALAGNEFKFVRHSQRQMERMLERFPLIVGHVLAGADQSMRWLRWLGAEFGHPKGKLIPFQIRKKSDG